MGYFVIAPLLPCNRTHPNCVNNLSFPWNPSLGSGPYQFYDDASSIPMPDRSFEIMRNDGLGEHGHRHINKSRQLKPA
jgi:hypothetical protein